MSRKDYEKGYQEGYIAGRLSKQSETETQFTVTRVHQDKYPSFQLPLDQSVILLQDMSGQPIGWQLKEG